MAERPMSLRDIGPIELLKLTIPADGGVVVLRGGQGTGKSTALRAIRKRLGADEEGLTARDGKKRGVLEFEEARLTVYAKRTKNTGELLVGEIESRLDVGALIDPKIKSPVSADAARIKALVALTGVTADKKAYYELVGSQEAYEALSVDDDTEDPLKLAARVKGALELRARQWESQRDTQKGHAEKAAENARDVDPNEPADSTTLQAVYDKAREEQVRIEEQVRAANDADNAALEAQESIKTAEQSYRGPTAKDAAEKAQAALDAYEKADDLLKDLARQVVEAKQARELRAVELREARAAVETAERHEETMAQWRHTLESALPDRPTAKQIGEAERAVEKAHQAMERGVLVRQAQEALLQAQKHTRLAQEAASQAARLRDLAADVDGVLSEALPEGALRIEGGRLVTETDRSKSELYAELSEGERAKIAIEIAAEQLPPNGILTMSQTSWEGLQPANQLSIRQLAKERRVTIITAEATDEDLHAEEFTSSIKTK